MFNRLTPKIVFHIFSFLSDREIASYACVSKSAYIDVLKSRMRAFSIGRERFKTLCLMNPGLAKFGIDIDSVRVRYLLLVNDICDIALINEEVATHIIGNTRLQKAGRLNGRFPLVTRVRSF